MSAEIIEGTGEVLLLCDHAANMVPDGITLGIAPALLDKHIAWDIGAGPLTRALAEATGAPAVLGTVSRLVIDLNRALDQAGLVPEASDGHPIPGNIDIDVAARIAAFHAPYHRAIADRIAAHRPRLIVAIHSFTSRLEGAGAIDRPWQAGILYGEHHRAAALPAIAFLRGEGLIVGDNEPYPGALYNATLDAHATGDIAAVNVEVRNDLIRDTAGIARWCDMVARMIDDVRNSLASEGRSAT
ncbi:N-formylglutamate amidohydrolase [Sphingomonas sp.]|uniref:N-formylglutamate amidohydrolase n=1 Tax=Sphingomonas sp. TaxID=28214 RepID=UPI002DD69530|nr:N-formylglutamate amidohydrolase [Sphingomonas sp.]